MRRAALAWLCASVLLAGGCAGNGKGVKPNVLIVPVTYERHLAAARNCTPVTSLGDPIFTYLSLVPYKGDHLALAFALGGRSSSSTSHSYSGGTTWEETSWSRSSLVGYRVFECPPAFMEKVRAAAKGKEAGR